MKFRILLQYFRVRHDKAPDYICKFICFKISTKYELKSDWKLLLLVPNCKMFPTLRTRVFSFATPYLWNSLPSNISGLDTISIFQRNLKTYLFRWIIKFCYFFTNFNLILILISCHHQQEFLFSVKCVWSYIHVISAL